jgi:hypothetical protein
MIKNRMPRENGSGPYVLQWRCLQVITSAWEVNELAMPQGGVIVGWKARAWLMEELKDVLGEDQSRMRQVSLCVSWLFIIITNTWDNQLKMRNNLFWLTVLEVPVHDQLAPVLLDLWWGSPSWWKLLQISVSIKVFFFFFFVVVLGFELRTSHLLDRCSSSSPFLCWIFLK